MEIRDDDYSPLDDFYVTSMSKDEAVQKLLGWQISCTHSDGSSGNLSDEDQEGAGNASVTVLDVFDYERTKFENDLFEAKHAQLPEAVIAEKRKALADFDKTIEKAKGYLRAIDDELSKGDDRSALRVDKNRQGNAGPYITIISFNEWVKKLPDIGIHSASPLITSADQIAQPASDKPWHIANPADPIPDYYWYTPARYFARQLVIDDSTLLTKRDLLAQKVAQSLAHAGIVKPGSKKPFKASTVRKAFSKVRLG